jgi:hypothetical protein
MTRNLALACVLAVGLAACGNTVSGLQYTPASSGQATPATAVVGSIASTDTRKERPTQLATVMGGFGNPLKTLETAKPVKDEVADAFVAGLRARGLKAPQDQAPFRLALLVSQFDADMYIGRSARITVTLTLINQAGATVYEDTVVDKESETKAAIGIFADVNDLKRLCEIVLARTVDTMLDKPGFRAALAGRPS